MTHTVEILHTGFVTHDTKRFVVSRPDDLDFEPGQGIEVAIPRGEWKDEGRPFTPTSLPGEPVLELTIKEYPEREGVTHELHSLGAGDELSVTDSFGTITYQGPGTFIAGGAGVTPFLAILRDLAHGDSSAELADCALFFSNKTPADVICEKELRHLLADRCHLLCSREEAAGYEHGRIDEEYLDEQLTSLDRRFYVCGPPAFVDDVTAALAELGADGSRIVVEE